MKRYRIEFKDEMDFEDDVELSYVYYALLNYLHECVKYQDVTAFEFTEVK